MTESNNDKDQFDEAVEITFPSERATSLPFLSEKKSSLEEMLNNIRFLCERKLISTYFIPGTDVAMPQQSKLVSQNSFEQSYIKTHQLESFCHNVYYILTELYDELQKVRMSAEIAENEATKLSKGLEELTSRIENFKL